MIRLRIDCRQEDVEECIQLAERVGAIGGELVMHPIQCYEVPEFVVPPEVAGVLRAEAVKLGVKSIRTSNS